MVEKIYQNLDNFQFRDLHPDVFIGTASDRYAGWIGQIYSAQGYRDKISTRSKNIGGRSYKEEVLPVESVKEYFQHFSILELDFTFYRLLMDEDLKPTPNYHVLRNYKKYLGEKDQLILKVPQAVIAQRLLRRNKFVENPDYLNPDLFIHQFYKPAIDLLDESIKGFIFEQEYQPKKERVSPEKNAEALDEFFNKIPGDDRYHMETRTESFLSVSYFSVFEKRGIGQVFSHWTWLPPLLKQFDTGNRQFFNSGKQCIIRLMTPLRMRYEDSYKKAYPFNRLQEGMLDPRMVHESVEIMLAAIDKGVEVNVIINNRAGGNAPIIAQKVVQGFLERHSDNP